MKAFAYYKLRYSQKILLAFFVVLLVVSINPAFAANKNSKVGVEQRDEKAELALMSMANFIAKASSFSMKIRSGYDAIQPNGQRIEFGEKRHIYIQRPNHLRVDTKRSDGKQANLTFDGKLLTIVAPNEKVFAQAEKQGSVDEIIVYLTRDFQIPLPLARLLITDFPKQIQNKITTIDYVESSTIFDVMTDHIAIRSTDVDMQMWITKNEQPLPRRIVLTYKNAPGEPQFWAELSEWSISSNIDNEVFNYTLPTGAEKVPLLTPVRSKGSIPAEKGESNES